MSEQVHIRNAEAAQLARALARQSGMTMSEVVLNALRQYRPPAPGPAPEARIELWRQLLREDGAAIRRDRDMPVEALYGEDGLPA